MKFFNLFKKQPTTVSAPASMNQVEEGREPITPEADNHNVAQPDGVISITYGTGMPIDVIYAFINHDYEHEGYQEALVNSDAEYCKAKESIILNQLQQLFRRILLRYRGEMRELDVKIENAKSLFALTSASQLDARKQTCEEHIAEINDMIEKVNTKSPEMMTMIESYRRGFTKGCAAQTANFLNLNYITA